MIISIESWTTELFVLVQYYEILTTENLCLAADQSLSWRLMPTSYTDYLTIYFMQNM